MMNEYDNRLRENIIQIIVNSPGIKAREIASKLGIDKRGVNSYLYGQLKDLVYQDKKYSWYLKSTTITNSSGSGKKQQISLKARLCRYYLDCISRDEKGISIFARRRYSLDYMELDSVPVHNESKNVFENEEVKNLWNKVRRDRSRLSLFLGYPCYLKKFTSRRGEEFFKVEPLLIYAYQENPGDYSFYPKINDEIPQLNFEALRSLSTNYSGNVMEEAIQLSEELGLSFVNEDIPDLDEIVSRFKIIRTEWNWQENPDPYGLILDPPLTEIEESGIYNRAILLVSERSPYTRGLETELGRLQSVDEDQYQNTALGSWLSGNIPKGECPPNRPLLEVLPLNSEQRQSVLQGLTNPLTVITGPPGTGKSQVVTSLLINAAWRNQKVLFASKNNKAVDVVETRVNALLPTRPVLLRLGRNEYQTRLTEYLSSLLSATASPNDEEDYNFYKKIHEDLRRRFDELESQMNGTISLRNEIDKLEQSIELYREVFSEDLFQSFRNVDVNSFQEVLEYVIYARENTIRGKQNILIKLFWPFVKNKRYKVLSEIAYQYSEFANALGLSVPDSIPNDDHLDEWLHFVSEWEKQFHAASEIHVYLQKLEELNKSRPLETINREFKSLIENLADNSEALWQCWLRLQPNRLDQQERKLLQEYTSIIQLIVRSDEDNQTIGKHVFRKYYQLFPKITNILSCWAVTSLSARGRIPFEPGFFDLLVIDEASQCDIASALPLLYRAKRAVIIGDPKQLKNISSLTVAQDEQFLFKHDLLMDHASWSYKVNSLYHLANGFCGSIALRDHHRSHSDIIDFSNKYFYEGNLRIATDYNRLNFLSRDEPIIRWINVEGKAIRPSTGGAVNETEARAVVKEIKRIVFTQNYQGTVGVVSPFRAQANRINDLVHHDDGLTSKVTSLEFLSNTVHKFQGDERDIIILSPTISPGIQDGALNFLRRHPNLFNVAITRARSALIVVGNYGAAIRSGVDYLARFAEYAKNIDSRKTIVKPRELEYGTDYPPVANPESVSDWERVFYKALFNAGLRPIPQYIEEKYALDFALFKQDRKLDIEVDGERYHRNWDGELCRRDQIRNLRLIELDWDVMRFWVYQIRDEMNNCIKKVKNWNEDNV